MLDLVAVVQVPGVGTPGLSCIPIPGVACIPTGVVTKGAQVVGKVQQVADFASDPMGYIAGSMQHAAHELATGIMPALSQATQPELSMDWFVSAYRVSFALAIFVWILVLIWNLVQYAGKKVSGDEVVQSFTTYSPLFIIGAIFGPMLGQFLVRFIGAINNALISFGVSKAADTTTKGLETLIATGEPNAVLGGSIVAIIMYFFMICGLLMALVTLVVMLVTLYFSGVVFPIGWAWITKAGDRSRGRKIPMVWAGVLCAQPLLFLMLGAALSLATGTLLGGEGSSKPLQTLVGLLVGAIALVMAGLSPVGLAKFAPVGPTDATPGGPSGRLPTGRGSRRGGAGPSSASDSQTSQIARMHSGAASTGSASAGGAGASGAGASGAAGGGKAGAVAGPAGMAVGAAAGGIAAAVTAMKNQAQEGGDSAATQGQESVAAGGSTQPEQSGQPGTVSSGGSASAAQVGSRTGGGSIPASGSPGDPFEDEPSSGSAAAGAAPARSAPSGQVAAAGAAPARSAPSGQAAAAAGGSDGGSRAVGGGGQGSGVAAAANTPAVLAAANPSGPGSVGTRAGSGGGQRDRAWQAASTGGQAAKRAASTGGQAAKRAAKTGNAIADLAQSVTDHAAGHMDHHKEGPRSR